MQIQQVTQELKVTITNPTRSSRVRVYTQNLSKQQGIEVELMPRTVIKNKSIWLV